MDKRLRAAVYARVSSVDGEPENQLRDLRAFVAARGWTATEFVDRGISGARERRPALDDMLNGVRRRRFDVVVVWRLDRFARNLRALLWLVDELHARGVQFVSLGEGFDTCTPSGRLQLQILGALAEFERARVAERVKAGLARVRAEGRRLGRRRSTPLPEGAPKGLTVRAAARMWGTSKSTAARWLAAGRVPAVGQTSLQGS